MEFREERRTYWSDKGSGRRQEKRKAVNKIRIFIKFWSFVRHCSKCFTCPNSSVTLLYKGNHRRWKQQVVM